MTATVRTDSTPYSLGVVAEKGKVVTMRINTMSLQKNQSNQSGLVQGRNNGATEVTSLIPQIPDMNSTLQIKTEEIIVNCSRRDNLPPPKDLLGLRQKLFRLEGLINDMNTDGNELRKTVESLNDKAEELFNLATIKNIGNPDGIQQVRRHLNDLQKRYDRISTAFKVLDSTFDVLNGYLCLVDGLVSGKVVREGLS
jgi:hypothetical protein